jgi:hypothetical protein
VVVAHPESTARGASRLTSLCRGVPEPIIRFFAIVGIPIFWLFQQVRYAIRRLPLRYAFFYYQMAPTALGGTAPIAFGSARTALGLFGFSTESTDWSNNGEREWSAGLHGVCIVPGMSALDRIFAAYSLPLAVALSAFLFPVASSCTPHRPSQDTLAKVAVLAYWFVCETTFRLIHCVSVSTRTCFQGGECRLYEAADEVKCMAGWQVPFLVVAVVIVLLPLALLAMVLSTPPTQWSEFVQGVMDESGSGACRPAWAVPVGMLLRIATAAAGVFLRTLPVGRAVSLASIFIVFATMQVWTRKGSKSYWDKWQHSFEVATLILLAVLAVMNIPTATLVQVPDTSIVGAEDSVSNGSLLFRRAVATGCLVAPIVLLIVIQMHSQWSSRRCCRTKLGLCPRASSLRPRLGIEPPQAHLAHSAASVRGASRGCLRRRCRSWCPAATATPMQSELPLLGSDPEAPSESAAGHMCSGCCRHGTSRCEQP